VETVAEYHRVRPAPALRPYVNSLVGYRLQGFDAGVHRGLPGRFLTLVITLDEPLDLTLPGGRVRSRYDALIGGLHDGPVHIHHDGSQFGLQIALEPLGARLLLGRPAADLAGTVVALDEVLGTDADRTVDRLREAPDWSARFAVLEGSLVAAAARHEDDRRVVVADGVVEAWARIVGSGGGVEIHRLARDIGWSRRHLGERVRAELGLSPKMLARMVRFERVQHALRRPDPPGLARLAAELGYYDQAHLTRDFRELAGCPPTRWLIEEELPFVQDE
jgi:AraC-like DNA-binding protein